MRNFGNAIGIMGNLGKHVGTNQELNENTLGIGKNITHTHTHPQTSKEKK